ncbi:helix-hairpin-helix domain-containing protein [uncultured Phocaeicola sp.]|jgi:competence ComEA-like helix-hairpin-helix protein|uniref:ComEA family DNA-binding protein n=1 Tax=uncultured Phocaeicola sp. TaxID=990718 RepID=UPI002588F44D|nr:helix-hairpin-helix domain-containing protein [uncultured Phocaeicola sp.]
MWKDFFYFSKKERRGIVFLLGMIVMIIGIWLVSPYLIEESDKDTNQESFEEMERFLAGIKIIEQQRNASFKKKEVVKRKVVLAPFEPNLADSIEFLQLGLPSFIAHNIIRYRQAGGKFATAEAFSRIYGITEEQFHTLEPYIYISESFQKKPDTLRYAKVEKRDTLAFYKYPEGTLVDLNRADTTELKKIPGIGIGIAQAIVAYRNRLGGFYDVAQLQELKWVTSDIQRWFKVENCPIHRINANKASLDRLRAHPYINYYQARVIVEFRRKKDKLKSLSQLSLYEEFAEKDLERLSHYLTFD